MCFHRMMSTLRRLKEKLAAISLDDPLNQQCFDDLDDARAKMRMVDVWMRSARNSGGSSRASGPTQPSPDRAVATREGHRAISSETTESSSSEVKPEAAAADLGIDF